MGLNTKKISVQEKKEFCAQLDSKFRLLWQGFVGQWNRYRKACLSRNLNFVKYTELAENLQIKEELLQNEVPVVKMYV